MSYVVKVGFDEIERGYFVLGSDIPGLNVETETFEEFVEVIRDVAPDLVARHGRELTIKFQREAI